MMYSGDGAHAGAAENDTVLIGMDDTVDDLYPLPVHTQAHLFVRVSSTCSSILTKHHLRLR